MNRPRGLKGQASSPVTEEGRDKDRVEEGEKKQRERGRKARKGEIQKDGEVGGGERGIVPGECVSNGTF